MVVHLEGVPVHLAHPDELAMRWVGQEEAMRQLLAAWLVIDETDVPMNPRLIGKPGVGKTTLAYAAAQRLDREVYIMQATVDTRPEDLIITPVIEGEGKLRYVASPLVTAMIRGGVCILDEGNRMSEKSWASLAPLLDSRRYVESIVAGVKVKAHPLFRIVATMNDDASTFDLPEYIHSRLQPQILIDFPERDEEMAILREIWHWRENEAIAANRPPFFILNHDRMLDLAAEAARQRGRVPLPRHLSPARQAGLGEAIRRALALPESEWPHPVRRVGRRLTDAQVRRADAIKAVRDQHATRLGIDPSLIAPRTTLLDLAHDWDTNLATLMRWQQALLVP